MSAEDLAAHVARRMSETGRRPGAAVSVEELLREVAPYESCRTSLELATKAEYDLAMLELLDSEELVVIREPGLKEAVREEREQPEPDLEFLEAHRDARLRLELGALPGDFGPGLPASGEPADEEEPAGEEPAPQEPTAEGAGGGEGPAAADAPPEGTEREDEGKAPPRDQEGWDPTGGSPGAPAGGAQERPRRPYPGVASLEEAAGIDREAALRGLPGRGSGGMGLGAAGRPSPRAPGRGTGCPGCGGSLPDLEGLRFCPHCGAEVLLPCPDCDAGLRPGWSYCPRCGARAAGSGRGESGGEGSGRGERE